MSKSEQLDLLNYDGAPSQWPDTSRSAAVQAMPFAHTLERKVLEFIRGKGEYGATDAEIQVELGLTPQTQVPRRNTLCRNGLLKDSGRRRPSPQTGRRIIIWIYRDFRGKAAE